MIFNKTINKKVILLLIFFSIIIFNLNSNNLKERLFLKNIKEKFVDSHIDIKMDIYYIPYKYFLSMPKYKEQMIIDSYSCKISISEDYLYDINDLLKNIDKLDIEFIPKNENIDIRLLYVIYTSKNKKILQVAIDNKCMIINGYYIKPNTYFYKLVINYLPNEDYELFKLIIKELEK